MSLQLLSFSGTKDDSFGLSLSKDYPHFVLVRWFVCVPSARYLIIRRRIGIERGMSGGKGGRLTKNFTPKHHLNEYQYFLLHTNHEGKLEKVMGGTAHHLAP